MPSLASLSRLGVRPAIIPRLYAPMFHMPMSSPMMTTMLGGFALVACACRVALPPAKTLETASAPRVSLRTLAPKSILLLFDRSRLVPAGRVLPSSASSLRLRMIGNCHLRQGGKCDYELPAKAVYGYLGLPSQEYCHASDKFW